MRFLNRRRALLTLAAAPLLMLLVRPRNTRPHHGRVLPSSSATGRVATLDDGSTQGGYTVGVLVQSNFGGVLIVDGVPVGEELAAERGRSLLEGEEDLDLADGSIMMVVATDAPADARQLKRIARRASFGLARTGSSGGHGSGDFVIAFSTDRHRRIDFRRPARWKVP